MYYTKISTVWLKKSICHQIFFAGLLIFGASDALAQEFANEYKNQPPISAAAAVQKDCPLLISVLSTENADAMFQIVNYSIQNVSRKPVLAYTLEGNGKGVGKIITSWYNKLFQPQTVKFEQFYEERANIRPESKLSLSIDYVLFADGSSWGEDKHQTSERIIQYIAGRKAAVEYVRKLIEKNNREVLSELFEQDIVEFQVPIPDSKMDEMLQRNFRSGYKSVLLTLQQNKDRDDGTVLKILDETDRIIEGFKK